MTNLPPELVTDIFTRLPVKSLLRFRCLSQFWCSQIDSRGFKKAHLSRSLKTGANLHVLLGYLGIRAVDLDRPDRATQLRPPFSATDFTTSINGLVLVLADNPFLWNPLTGKFHQLPSPPPEKHASDVGSVFENFGFGYDSGRDDYVVVRVIELRDEYHNWMRSEAMIYSCNSGTWRKTSNFPYTLPYKRVWGVHLNGVLHTATCDGNDSSPEWFISAFDVQTEKHLTLPKPRIIGPDAEFAVERLGGYLCLVRLKRGYKTDIWMMKEYGVEESWTLLLTLAPPVVESYTSLCPLAFSKDGQEVLLNFDDQRLIWYHLKRKTVRTVTVAGLPSMFYADVCVASLIHPGPLEAGQQQRYREVKTLVGRKSSKKRDDFLSKGFKLVL